MRHAARLASATALAAPAIITMGALRGLGDNPFDAAELTQIVNSRPHQPTQLSEWLDWDEQGVMVRDLKVRFNGESLDVVDPTDPSAPGEKYVSELSAETTIEVPHYKLDDTLPASEIAAVMAVQDMDERIESANEVVQRRQLDMRKRLEVTREFARWGAVTGKLIRKDGRVILDFADRFKVEQPEQLIDLDDATTDVLELLREAKEISEDALGADMADSYVLAAGRNAYKRFRQHPRVLKLFEGFAAGTAVLQADDRERGFQIVEGVTLRNAGKAKIKRPDGSILRFIGDDEALLLPKAPIWHARNAPAVHLDYIGTVGLPYYAHEPEAGKFKAGTETRVETNYIAWCSKLQSVVKLITA